MSNYRIISRSKRGILWGDFDSDLILKDIKEHIEISESTEDEVELDFKGIKSVDYSFIDKVFIKLLEDRREKPFFHLVFTNIEYDSIIYYLNQSFSKNNFVAHVKIKNKIRSIGSEVCII
jgi:heat shock protein HspQ